MANIFDRADSTATIAGVTAYTVPTGSVAVVIGFTCSNTDTEQRTVTVEIEGTNFVNKVPIPANSTLSILDGKRVLKSDESVIVSSDADGVIDVMIDYLEQT